MKGVHLLAALLVLACIGLLAVQAENPLLWTAENLTDSGGADLSAAEKMDTTQADSVLPLMQEILGQGNTVVLSVQVKNWESAQRDLKKYSEMTRSMNNLVLKLDLTGTDIDEFQKQSKENLQSLTTLVNGSARLEEVQIEYRDEKDPGKLYSLTYEGEALKKELQGVATSYKSASDVTVPIGKKYGADTSAQEESVESFETTVGKETETASSGSVVSLPPPALTLVIEPAEARFGDLVTLRGTAPAGETVEAFVDSRKAGSAQSRAGNFAVGYRIEKGRAGTHLAYVRAGDAVSDLVEFTVIASAANLTLTANRSAVSGTFTANGRGVEGAAVALLIDGTETATLTTGEGGAYGGGVNLTEGRHTLQAVFSGDGYPLEEAKSPEVVVEVEGFPAGPVALFILLGGAGGCLYIRHRGKEKKEVRPTLAGRLETPLPEKEEQDAPITIAGLSPEGAAVVLWQGMADAAERQYGVKNARARTPREIVAALVGTPAHDPTGAFAMLYEAIRYAGLPCGEEEVGRLKELYDAVVSREKTGI